MLGCSVSTAASWCHGTLVFDRFRFKLRTRELLRVAEDGAETPIPLRLRTTDVIFLLERPGSGDEGRFERA